MATLILRICDECGKEATRLLKIEEKLYCSRECYLAACKRIFDNRWFELLKQPPVEQPQKPALSNIA